MLEYLINNDVQSLSKLRSTMPFMDSETSNTEVIKQ